MLIENSDNQKQAPHIFESDSDICSEKEIHALNTLFKLNLNATAAIEELPFKSKNIFKKAINHALLKLGSRNKFDIEAIYSSITERNDENIPYDKQRCLDDINKRFKAMIGKDKIDPRHCGKDYEHLALELKKLRQN
jgi:hypothetical protein